MSLFIVQMTANQVQVLRWTNSIIKRRRRRSQCELSDVRITSERREKSFLFQIDLIDINKDKLMISRNSCLLLLRNEMELEGGN